MTTFKERPASVTLISYTPNPLDTVYQVWCRAKDFEELPRASPERRAAVVDAFKRLIFDYTQIPEMVGFCWWIDDVPRAFFDQVVRHRKTAVFARSQRVRRQLNFARRGEYLTTTPITRDPQAIVVYEAAMHQVEMAYGRLLELGVPQEDARGILPLHLRTGFGWGTSLRDLADVFRTRTCHLLQQEYWAPVAAGMRRALATIDPELDMIFQPPCKRGAGCVSDHDAALRAGVVIKGEHPDPAPPCRLWADMFAPADVVGPLKAAVAAGRAKWAVSPEEMIGNP